LRPYRLQVAVAAVLLVLITGASIAVPQFIRLIVDRGIRAENLAFLGPAVAALLALTAFKGALTFVQGRLIERASQGVAYDLRKQLHHKLTRLSFAFHTQSESGQLLSRSVQDVDRIRFLCGRASLRLIDGAVMLLGTGALMFWMSPQLAALSVAMMPFLVWRAIAYGRKVRPLSVQIQEQLAVLTTRIEQNVRGARIVKAFTAEEREIERFRRENEQWFDLTRRHARLQAVNAPMLQLIANVGMLAVIWYGGYLITQDLLSYGELVAFTSYLMLLSQPVRLIGMIAPVVGMAIAAGDRVFDILDRNLEIDDASQAVRLDSINGEVEFDSVSFGYPGRDYALSGVSFRVEPGEVIALLGATGSGKSTVVNLIPRFYEATEGTVRVDGRDVREIALSSLRAQVGIVMQETTLFATTIRENIRFSRSNATEAEIRQAAEAAQAHSFIAEFPEGYDTVVGELGRTLSGGQKQRIAIARALLMDPAILLLDDATSSVDTETEARIQEALQTLMENRTSFVIAQRLSTLRLADRILVLEDGRLTAQGTHEHLMEHSPLYREVYERQSGTDGGGRNGHGTHTAAESGSNRDAPADRHEGASGGGGGAP
jgi:ATP-binding cassette subfamily B protein